MASTLPATLCVDHEPPSIDSVEFKLENLEMTERSTTFSPKSDVCIGRDPTKCSLVFPEAGTLSRIHCKVFSLGRDVFVVDMSSNGTFVNGKIVGKDNRRVLRSGDVVSLVNPQLPESTRLSWRFLSSEDSMVNNIGGTGPQGGIGVGGLLNASELEQAYELGPVLGTGNFAKVRLGTHRISGRKVAVKIVEKKRFALSHGDFSFASLQSEVEILRKMNHKNIITMWDVYDDPRFFTMVLELVSNGDFFDYIAGRAPNPFTETEAKTLFVQLLDAMLYMHDKDVVHRDLKPENILVHVDPAFSFHKTNDNQRNAPLIPVEKVTLKITDFGLAKFCTEQDVMQTMCGTPVYLAPEVLHADVARASAGVKKAEGYSWSVDVWSLGVILYVMLSGCLPKDPQSGVITYNKYMENISAESKHLMEWMLKVNPNERADLSDICNHSWLKGETIELRRLACKKDRLVLSGTILNFNTSANISAGFVSSTSTESVASAMSKSAPLITSTLPPESVPPPKTTAVPEADGHDTDVDSDEELESRAAKRARVEKQGKVKQFVWYWKKTLHLGDDDSNAWQAYALDDCERIEKARERGAKSVKVGNTNDYRISLEGMFQYSTKDPTRQRPVKRIEI